MRVAAALILILLAAGFAAADVQYLPHVVVGGGYTTTINATNLVPDQTDWILIYFYRENGAAWTVPTNLGNYSRVDLWTGPYQTQTVVLSSQSTVIESGWAMVVSPGPAVIAATYAATVDAVPVASAGMLPSLPDVLSILPVSVAAVTGRDTGIALVNPSHVAGDATLELMDAQGAVVGTRTVPVTAKGKFVGFLTSAALFPGVTDLDGFVRVTASQPMAAAALRIEGVLFSALPAVHDTLPWRNSNTIYVSPLTGQDSIFDGSFTKPFKTIRKALTVADRGWTIYLLPGLYSEDSGERFPIRIKYCTLIKGADARSVIILGGGTPGGMSESYTLSGEDKGMIANITVMNPDGIGLYSASTVGVTQCRFIHCAGAGIKLVGGRTAITDCTVSGNAVGVFIGGDAAPDLGGGQFYNTGGNFLMDNEQCDLFIEESSLSGCCSRLISIRFNGWDHPIPTRSSVCIDGVDIASPAGIFFEH